MLPGFGHNGGISKQLYSEIPQQEHGLQIHLRMVGNHGFQDILPLPEVKQLYLMNLPVRVKSGYLMDHGLPVPDKLRDGLIFQGKLYLLPLCLRLNRIPERHLVFIGPFSVNPGLRIGIRPHGIAQLCTEGIVQAQNFFLFLPLPLIQP